jgi:hypothetical protein
MILLDLDKRITIFAPGRVGSTSLSETIHPLTTNRNMPISQAHNFLTPIISKTPIPANYYNTMESSRWHPSMSMNMSTVDLYMLIRNMFSKDFDKHYVIIRNPVDRFISGCEMLLQLSGKDGFLQFYDDMSKDKFVNLIAFCIDHPFADFHLQPYMYKVSQLDCDFVHLDQVSTLIKDLYNMDMLHIDPSADWLTEEHKNKFRSFAKEHKQGFIDHIIKEIELYNSLDIS